MTGNGKLGGRVSVWEVTKNWQKYKKMLDLLRESKYKMVIQEVRIDKHRLHSESSCIDAEQSRQYPASCALTIELLQTNVPLW